MLLQPTHSKVIETPEVLTSIVSCCCNVFTARWLKWHNKAYSLTNDITISTLQGDWNCSHMTTESLSMPVATRSPQGDWNLPYARCIHFLCCCNLLTAKWLKPIMPCVFPLVNCCSQLTVRWLKLTILIGQACILVADRSPQGDWNVDYSLMFSGSKLRHAHHKVIET